jgi:DNA-binding MarR family transcriptional regulator
MAPAPIIHAISREERIKTIKSAFHSLMWIATRHFSQYLQSYKLTYPQFIALASLAAHKQACTMSDLTGVTFQDAPTMTGIIDRLVKMKFVQRNRSETDRRVVLVQATPAGAALVEQIEAAKMRDDLMGYAALTDDDLAALEELLRYILRMHVGRCMPAAGAPADLDAEIEKLQRFMEDPIYYATLEHHP